MEVPLGFLWLNCCLISFFFTFGTPFGFGCDIGIYFMQEPEPIDWEYYRKGIGSRLVDMYKEAYESEIPIIHFVWIFVVICVPYV